MVSHRTGREENRLVRAGERTELTHDGMSSDNAVNMGTAMVLEWTLLPKISAGMGGIGDAVENYARDNGNEREGDMTKVT
jgi:hypothetical protein